MTNQKTGFKAMYMKFFTQTGSKRVGGEENIHFKYVTPQMENKRMLKKQYKKAYEYHISHPLIQTLNSYIEASKCRTLDSFTNQKGGEIKCQKKYMKTINY